MKDKYIEIEVTAIPSGIDYSQINSNFFKDNHLALGLLGSWALGLMGSRAHGLSGTWALGLLGEGSRWAGAQGGK
jgi:hypothetical protein